MRMQLTLEELIGEPLVDQDWSASGRILDPRHDLGRIVATPLPSVRPKITGQRLLTPGALLRSGNRSKRRDRLVDPGVAQPECQGAVSTHRVAEDPRAAAVGRELRFDQRPQLLGHVRVHPEMLLPWLLSRIHIEAGTHPEIPGVALSRQLESPRARVRRHEHETELRRHALGSRLDHERLLRAGQPGKVVKHGHPARSALGRSEYRKTHRGSRTRGLMPVEADDAIEAAMLTDDFESGCIGHSSTWTAKRKRGARHYGLDERPALSPALRPLH